MVRIHPRQPFQYYVLLAQSVEHLTFNQRVWSSNLQQDTMLLLEKPDSLGFFHAFKNLTFLAILLEIVKKFVRSSQVEHTRYTNFIYMFASILA